MKQENFELGKFKRKQADHINHEDVAAGRELDVDKAREVLQVLQLIDLGQLGLERKETWNKLVSGTKLLITKTVLRVMNMIEKN